MCGYVIQAQWSVPVIPVNDPKGPQVLRIGALVKKDNIKFQMMDKSFLWLVIKPNHGSCHYRVKAHTMEVIMLMEGFKHIFPKLNSWAVVITPGSTFT